MNVMNVVNVINNNCYILINNLKKMFEHIKQCKQRVAIYSRVSTEDQVEMNWLDIQYEAILRYIKTHSDKYTFHKANLYIDEWKSGANKSKEDRPALHKMYQDASNKRFEIVFMFFNELW